MKVQSRYGATYAERYSLRDGIRVGGLTRAELINPGSREPADEEARRRLQRVDTLYREWARNRTDVGRLRRLQSAIEECLTGADG